MTNPILARTILHLGSGKKYHPDALNIDLVPRNNPDILHNLDLTPWPLPNDHFREVWAFDVIEHLTDVVKVMEEIHRVCSEGAVVKITVPHFSSANAFTDPTHRHYFGWHSMDYFTGEHQHSYYSKVRFQIRVRSLNFHPTLTNKFIHRFAKCWPTYYERRWAWIFPAWFLYFELLVLKAAT